MPPSQEGKNIIPTYKDEDRGTWYCQFYYTDWNGKRIYKKKRGFPRKKDAVEWERTFKNKRNGSMNMTFDSFIEIQLEDANQRTRASSSKTTENVINMKLLPKFTGMRCGELMAITLKLPPDTQIFQETTKRTIDKRFKKYSNQSGVPEIRIHDLGHEDITTTLNIYGHLYPNKQAEVVDKLEELQKQKMSQK